MENNELISLNIVKEYFNLQKKLFEYFGYVENWRCIPPDHRLGHYWMIIGPEDKNTTKIVWSEKPFTKESIEKGDYIYGGTLYTQRYLSKWVYRNSKHTMVLVDTHTDCNQMLMIFDNDKECKDQEMKNIYNECW